MPSWKRTAPPQPDSAVPTAGRGGASAVLRRIGTRIGLLDLDSADEAAEARVANHVNGIPPPKEIVSLTSPEQSGHAAEVAAEITALGQDLDLLNRGLARGASADPATGALPSVLSQKKV